MPLALEALPLRARALDLLGVIAIEDEDDPVVSEIRRRLCTIDQETHAGAILVGLLNGEQDRLPVRRGSSSVPCGRKLSSR